MLNALLAKMGCFLFDLFAWVVILPFDFPLAESTGRPFDCAAIVRTDCDKSDAFFLTLAREMILGLLRLMGSPEAL